MGWSIGSATPLALLGHPDAVPKDLYAKLEPSYRLLIFYDPPHLTFGYDQPPEGYNPWTDPDYPTPIELFDNFRYWCSGYYEHPGRSSRDVLKLNFSKRGERPSVDNMTAEEYAKNFDGLAASRCEFPMYFPMQPVLRVQAGKALWDEEAVRTVLPRVEVALLTCTAANWYCVYGFIETEKRYKEYLAKGAEVRPIRFIEIEGGNHFIHWDDPVAFWAATVKAINGN
ncbi:hypothetical protein OE88DRAFT_1715420 [Heliocybe sulcata]|uniref:AB hydrolase-1 domain-containing protein n=1 Tax=Heliocybe sulcata TaxID=5364 RepID=A0A5C3MMR7_9AGAM|nr:hypothetical protein OE88DRAFT_1715420 [Heliocybe sulcata]